MTSQEFVYWLQGFLEVANPETIDAKQLQVIKDHIALVLHKVTPNRNDDIYPPFDSVPTLPGRWINHVNRPAPLCDVKVTCSPGDKVSDALKAADMSYSVARNGDLIPMFGDPPGSC